MSELVVRVSADIKKLQAGYKSAEKETEDFSKMLSTIGAASGIAFAGITTGVGLMVAEYQKAAREDNKLRAALEATGGAAGYTYDELKKMSDELEVLTGIEGETITASETLLLTFNKISGQAFPAALKAAADLSVLLDTDLKSATLQVGKALQDPIEGLAGLGRVGIKFSEDQKKVIEALVRTGEVGKAQEIILQALGERTGGLAAKASEGSEGFNQLKKQFGDVAENIGEKFLPVANKAAQWLGDFLELVAQNDAMIGIAARLLTIGGALTGLASAGSIALIGIVQVRNALTTLGISFGAARVQAALFWGAATLGVATLITFLPEIIDYVKEFTRAMAVAGGDVPKDLKEINNELERLAEKRKIVANGTDMNFSRNKKEALAEIDERIEAIEKLKKAQEETDAKNKPKERDPAADALAAEAEATRKLDEETQKRLAISQNALAVQKLQREGASKEELEFVKQKQELMVREEAAGREKVAEIRNSELEAIKLEKEALLLAEQEYYDNKADLIIQAREEQALLDEELRALTVEERSLLDDEDLQALRDKIKREQDIKAEVVSEDIARNIESNNRMLKDKEKFGTAYAKINQFMHTEEVQGAEAAANQLVALTQSKNSTLKGIGKAAALTQVAISTAQGAIGAYAALAPIPFVGPALGIIAAGALTAFGIERASQITAAADGGLLTGGVPGRDSIPVLGMPGELVVPTKNYEEVVGAVREQRAGGSGNLNNELLQEISDKLDNVGGGGVVVQGDFIGDDTYIDRLVSRINDRIEYGNLQLRTS